MSTLPNHIERQFMQRLRGRGWVRALDLPHARTTIQYLLQKRWIESEGTGRTLAFRLTEEGLAAKRAPIPMVKWRRKGGDRYGEVVQSRDALWLHQA
jgi:hypothetical protein